MNNVFSITRFGKVLKNEIIINYKNIITLAVIAVIPFMFYLIFKLIFFSYNPNASISMELVGILCVLAPFILYKNIFHRIKGVSYSMLPASNTEKFFSIWLQSVIIIPLLLTLVTFIFTVIMSIMNGTEIPNPFGYLFTGFNYSGFGESHSFIDTPYWAILTFQSISIWGVCFFKTSKIRKTILTFIAFFIFIVIALVIATRIYGGNIINLMDAMNESVVWNNIGYAIVIAFPIVFWAWAFYKFNRQQI